MNFEFGSFSLDVDRQELAGPEGPIDIEPQVFALLALLVSNSDRVVSKDEIIEHVWDGRAISDANLNTRINAARRAVGDDGKTQAVIRTFPRRGFRFVADIQQTAPTPAQRERNGRSRVLVLPFRNQSSDPEMDYLAETLTEDVIAVLSRSPQFIVTPRAAAFAYRNDDVNVGELWREHGIRYVVEGSIRRMGHRLQISALLNHAEDDIVIWSDKYVRDDDDVFAMGEDVTSRIVAAVGPTMGQTDRRRAMAADDPGAWEYYLRGNSLIFDVGNSRRSETIPAALGAFQKSMALDPDLAEAKAGYAKALWQSVAWSFEPNRQEAIQTALVHAREAVIQNASNSEILGTLGLIQTHVGQLRDGISTLRRAEKLEASNMHHKIWLSIALISDGDIKGARRVLELVQDAGDREAVFAVTWVWLAFCSIFEGDFETAEQLARDAVDHHHPKFWANVALVVALVHLGKMDEATSQRERLQAEWPGISCAGIVQTTPMTKPEMIDLIVNAMRKAGLPE